MGYLIFVARCGIGMLLIAAGGFKVHDGPNAFASSIAAYRLLSPEVVRPLALLLPFAEIALGFYLLVGLFTRVVATVSAVQFSIFAVAVGSLVVRGIPADCGCFGSGRPEPPSWGHVGADVFLALGTLAIARFGPGAFALDTRLATGGARLEGEA